MARNPKGRDAVGEEMLPKGKRNYCKVTVHENGVPLIRRCHALLIQAKNGLVYLLEGPDLPIAITLFTGTVQAGRNMVQILMDPDSEIGAELRRVQRSIWLPTRRDAVVALITIVTTKVLSVFFELLLLAEKY